MHANLLLRIFENTTLSNFTMEKDNKNLLTNFFKSHFFKSHCNIQDTFSATAIYNKNKKMSCID